MKKWKTLITVISIAFLLFLVIVLLNQSLSLAANLAQVNPWLGQAAGILILGIYLAVFAYITYSYYRIPKPLPAPPPSEADEYQDYLLLVEKRLRSNENLTGLAFDQRTRENVHAAMAKLDTIAQEEISNIAKKTFLITAISQNGKLDGLMVFILLIKLTTKIAYLYNQRPSVKELITLYINVFATIFIVTEMDDAEIIHSQLEPIMDNLTSSFTAAFAGQAGKLGAAFANAAFQGAINSLLVMRVGFIAIQYSLPLKEEKRITILTGATMKAAQLIGTTLGDSAKTLIKIFVSTAKNKAQDSAQSGLEAVKATFNSGSEKVKETGSTLGIKLGKIKEKIGF